MTPRRIRLLTRPRARPASRRPPGSRSADWCLCPPCSKTSLISEVLEELFWRLLSANSPFLARGARPLLFAAPRSASCRSQFSSWSPSGRNRRPAELQRSLVSRDRDRARTDNARDLYPASPRSCCLAKARIRSPERCLSTRGNDLLRLLPVSRFVLKYPEAFGSL